MHTDFCNFPIVGASPPMERVFELIKRAAETRSPVLILGESGTGKELVARAIHEIGPWRDLPFIPVDCPSLVPSLIESELFGHIRGAFTGAESNKEGLFARAGKGTLFLDEIAELPLELQARLLRVLQEREFKPVGSSKRWHFPGRILAATNRNLIHAVRAKSFRQDLYFRLNVLSITLPPLRERKDDIPILAEHILRQLSSSVGTNGAGTPYVLSSDAMHYLLKHDWPGNVRELQNCLERATVFSSSRVIRSSDLSLSLDPICPNNESSQTHNTAPLEDLTREAILQTIRAVGGNKILAARILGIGKTTLYRKLRSYRDLE